MFSWIITLPHICIFRHLDEHIKKRRTTEAQVWPISAFYSFSALFSCHCGFTKRKMVLKSRLQIHSFSKSRTLNYATVKKNEYYLPPVILWNCLSRVVNFIGISIYFWIVLCLFHQLCTMTAVWILKRTYVMKAQIWRQKWEFHRAQGNRKLRKVSW